MQDGRRQLDEKPLATHGRPIHWVKKGEISLPADVFRFAPDNRQAVTTRHHRFVPIGDISALQTAARWARLLCVATELVHHCDP
jgi:hypothetical protein